MLNVQLNQVLFLLFFLTHANISICFQILNGHLFCCGTKKRILVKDNEFSQLACDGAYYDSHAFFLRKLTNLYHSKQFSQLVSEAPPPWLNNNT